MNLYELSTAYQQIQAMIEDGQDGLEDTLEALNDAIEVKAENYAKIIRNLEGQALALKSEEERLASRRKSLENNIKRLKDNLQQSMINTGIKKIKTDLFSFNIQKNPPSVEVISSEDIPERYLVPQEPKLNRKAILDDLKSGKEIPGVQLKQTEGLRIR